MRRKQIVFTLVMAFSLLLASTCFAEEKPLGDITSAQEVIDKCFTGRTLDPIEGIWIKDKTLVIAIVKTSLTNTKNPKYQKSDYLGIVTKGNSIGEMIVFLKKTEYSFAFDGMGDGCTNDGLWKLLTPTVLQFDGINLVGTSKSFVRIYPPAP